MINEGKMIGSALWNPKTGLDVDPTEEAARSGCYKLMAVCQLIAEARKEAALGEGTKIKELREFAKERARERFGLEATAENVQELVELLLQMPPKDAFLGVLPTKAPGQWNSDKNMECSMEDEDMTLSNDMKGKGAENNAAVD